VDPRGELQTHPSGRQRTRPYVELAATFPHHHRTLSSYNDTAIRHRRLNHEARWDTGSRHRTGIRGGGFLVAGGADRESALRRKEASHRAGRSIMNT
jgi:hypothetical protein